MAELVDAHDSKSCTARCVGSIPTLGTIEIRNNHSKTIYNEPDETIHLVHLRFLLFNAATRTISLNYGLMTRFSSPNNHTADRFAAADHTPQR